VEARVLAREELHLHHPLAVADERLRVRAVEAEDAGQHRPSLDAEEGLELGPGEGDELVVGPPADRLGAVAAQEDAEERHVVRRAAGPLARDERRGEGLVRVGPGSTMPTASRGWGTSTRG